jgi:hypothetical protein
LGCAPADPNRPSSVRVGGSDLQRGQVRIFSRRV